MWIIAIFVIALVGSNEAVPTDFCEEVDESALKCSLNTLFSARVNASRPAAVTHIEIVCMDRQFFHENMDLSSLAWFTGLKSLSISHCQLGSIRSDALRNFVDLRALSVRTYNREYLSEQLQLEHGCFDGLIHLETLDLSENNIWSLQPGSLSTLKSLQTLNISGNRFQDLMDIRAAGLSRGLMTLDLSRNNIIEVASGGVGELPGLEELYVSNNHLQLLQDGALRGLSSLQTLDISFNHLVALPAMLLNETRQLRQLQLHNNSISVLPPGLLADLPQLQTVNMSSNKLSSQWIRKDTFAGLFRLIVLDLSNNVLSSLNQDVFDDLSSLQVLDISQNNLQKVPNGLFSALSNLHTLSLSNNKISQLEQRSLAGVDVLNRLRMDNNQLTQLDDNAFVNATGVKQLFLANNRLSTVPAALQRLTSLQQLDLSGNRISSLRSEELRPLKHITYLQLANNQLTNVSADLLQNQKALTLLDMSGNRISAVESGAFDKAVNLKAIRLDGNDLRNINGLFAKLPQLVWLNVSDNRIEFFDYALIPAGLRWLDLHQNQLREIGNFYNIESKVQLETLDISHNQVSLISGASVPDGIKYFIVASNQLETVEPGTFEAKYQLVRADLSGNQLSELDLTAVTLSANVPDDGTPEAELLLAGNPFFCDCQMDWLITIDRMTPTRRYPKVLDAGRIMCRLLHSPHSLTPLSRTKPNDFLCTYERHCFALCHCCNYVACDCEMKCPDGCTCYRDHTWNTNIVDCSRREEVAISREIPMDATAVFADGNNIRSLDSHTFIGRKRIRHLYVNSSNVQEIQNRSLSGLSALQVLRLENNAIKSLQGYEFGDLKQLRELYLHQNELSAVHSSTFSSLHALEVLTLHSNRLALFPVWQLASNSYLVDITLSGNPWSCACLPRSQLEKYVDQNRGKIEDASQVQCEDASAECASADRPPTHVVKDSVWPFVLLSLSILAVAAAVIGVVFKYRARVCSRKPPTTALPPAYGVAVVSPQTAKLYDVFVTYSAQDAGFVNEVLAMELEQKLPFLELCLLRRDAPNTSYLGDAVHHCVTASRKTLVVLSRSFLDNEWCRFDFKASHLAALKLFRDIIVLLHGVERSAIDGELKSLLKGASFISYGDVDCWKKLRSLLPHINSSRNSFRHKVANRACGVHDVQDKNYAQQTIGLPVVMYTLESPSSTYSTEISEETPPGLPPVLLDPSRMLSAVPHQQHNTSRSSLQPSEHTYMYIDQYQGSLGSESALCVDQSPDIYSALEPELQPPMPSLLTLPGFCDEGLPYCGNAISTAHVHRPCSRHLLRRQRSLQLQQRPPEVFPGHPAHQAQRSLQDHQQWSYQHSAAQVGAGQVDQSSRPLPSVRQHLSKNEDPAQEHSLHKHNHDQRSLDVDGDIQSRRGDHPDRTPSHSLWV